MDRIWRDFKGHREFDRFTENEATFIAGRDSFYMATVSETGWPYVQHRGGPRGFIRLVDDHTLAFADYRGNRQYISTGNLAADDRACLFLMDYPHRARLKIYAHVETLALDDNPDLTAVVAVPDYKAKLERIFRLRLKTFDWNCQQHITPRFTEHDIAEAVRPLRDRLAQLESENAELHARLTPKTENPDELAFELCYLSNRLTPEPRNSNTRRISPTAGLRQKANWTHHGIGRQLS